MYREQIATFDRLLRGYSAALARLLPAMKETDADAAFAAAFETLNWAVVLDERIASHWAPRGDPLGWLWRDEFPSAAGMAGVRFARNRVHHQWSDALVLTDGVVFPASLPVAMFSWLWQPADELPAGRPDSVGKRTYREHLQGHRVETTVTRVGYAFQTVRDLSEPRRGP